MLIYNISKLYNNLKRKCEFIIENYNALLQAIIIISLLYIGYFQMYMEKAVREVLIIELLSIMMLEILVIAAKDSITQNKLNKLLVITNSINQLVPVSPERLDDFEQLISSTSNDLYISGIACNNVWIHMNRIIELLDKGCHIKLLISDENRIDDNAKFFFGLDEHSDEDTIKTAIEDVTTKIAVTLNNFKLNDTIKRYYCKNMFEIRRSSQPFTVAFVGVDLETNRTDKLLKITQYTYGCKNTQDCPRFLITLPEHEHWFKYYEKIILEQWNNAEKYILTDSCDIYNSNDAIMEIASTNEVDQLNGENFKEK